MLVIVDIINSILQATMFILLPDYCVSEKYKHKKGVKILAIITMWLSLQLVMKIAGNSSISIFLSHLLPFIIVLLFYRKDKFSIVISYSILYLMFGSLAMLSNIVFFGFIQPRFFVDNLELGMVLCIYLVSIVVSFIVILNKDKFYKVYRLIKSRNISVVFLVMLTVILDLTLSFDKLINWNDNPMLKNYIFLIIAFCFAAATVYFASVEKKVREIALLNNAIEEKLNELNKVKHDYGAQISYLYGLHLMGKHDRAGELLKDIINNHNSIAEAIEISNNSDSTIAIVVRGLVHKGINVILDEQADLEQTEITEFELQKVISNIVSNSVTAMKGKGILTIRTYENFNNIVIKIQNNGPKIEETDIKKIFKAGFSTKDNIKKDHGFGLNIVKETIENYGGSVLVESDCERTEFIIQLPRKEK